MQPVMEKPLILYGPFKSLNHLCNCGYAQAKRLFGTDDVELQPGVLEIRPDVFVVVAVTPKGGVSPHVEGAGRKH